MSRTETASQTQTTRTPAFSGDEPLVQAVRGEFVESVHRGSIAVADVAGTVVAGIGNIRQRAFMRSGAKPFQVIPALVSGGIERYGITTPELAVLCSSHSGEPRQVDAVISVLRKIGLDESALYCGIHPPLNPEAAADRWRKGLEPTPACSNCSGAHAGMLLTCVANGWPIESYTQPSHALQRQIRAIVREFAGAEEGEIEEAIDNCTVPTFRLPLIRSATAFARLAAAAGVRAELLDAAKAIRRAMTSHPDMVGGEDRFDSDLMRATTGDMIAKGGADGFGGVGIIASGFGLALKISDGGAVAAPPATMRALADLGVTGSSLPRSLEAYAEPTLLDMRGNPVGRVSPIFHLEPYR